MSVLPLPPNSNIIYSTKRNVLAVDGDKIIPLGGTRSLRQLWRYEWFTTHMQNKGMLHYSVANVFKPYKHFNPGKTGQLVSLSVGIVRI